MQGTESARIPKEFSSAFAKQPLLIRKEFYFGADLKASLVNDKDILKITLDHYKVANDMMQFLRRAV